MKNHKRLLLMIASVIILSAGYFFLNAPKSHGEIIIIMVSNNSGNAIILHKHDIQCIGKSLAEVSINRAIVRDKSNFVIKFELTQSGENKLSQFTQDNIGKVIQIIYNKQVISTGVIKMPVSKNFEIKILSRGGESLFIQIKQGLDLQSCEGQYYITF